MPGLLEALLGDHSRTIEQVRSHTGNDPQRAEQAYGAAVGTILKGLETRAQSQEGSGSILDMIRRHVERGNIPAEAPSPEVPSREDGVQVREMDPQEVGDIMKVIFGKDAPNVEGAYGKVITLDPETSKKVFAKVLPAVLGSIFGAAEKDPEDTQQALPRIVGNARNEMEERQPKSANILSAILDQDGDGDVDLNDLAGIFARKPR